MTLLVDKVQPAQLHAPRLPAAELPGLAKVAERFARGLAELLGQWGRTSCPVVATPPRAVRAADWRKDVAERAIIAIQLPELHSVALITLPLPFCVRLIDKFYGGTGEISANRTTLGRGEIRTLAALGKQLCPIITAAWSEILPLSPTVASAGRHADAPLPAADVALTLLSFRVDAFDASIDFVLPAEPLHALPALLAATPAIGKAYDAAWRFRLEDALLAAHVPVRTVIARPELTVERLMQLAPGDFIPLCLPALVPLTAAGKLIGYGSVGDANGKVAVKLEQLEGQFRYD